jgi:prolyl oligopeptidase
VSGAPGRDDSCVDVIHGRRVSDPYRSLEDTGDDRVQRWWGEQIRQGARRLSGYPQRQRCAELLLAARAPRSPSLLRRTDHGTLVVVAEHPGSERLAYLPDAPDDPPRYLTRAPQPSISGLDTLPSGGAVSWLADGRAFLADLAGDTVEEIPAARGVLHTALLTPDRLALVAREAGAVSWVVLERTGPGEWKRAGDRPIALDRDVVAVTGSPARHRFCLTCRTPPYADTDLVVLDSDGQVAGRSGVLPGLVDARFATEERLLLRTDIDEPDFRVAIAAIDALSPDRWRTVARWRDRVVTDVTVADGRWFALVDRDGASELYEIPDGAGGSRQPMPLPLPRQPALATALAGGTGARLAVAAESPACPPGLFLLDAGRTGGPTVHSVRSLGQPAADPGAGHVLSTTEVAVGAAAVPVALLRRDDLVGEPRPTLLSIYGGFGIPQELRYSPLAAAWVRAGGTFVVAGICGGGERGRRWHLAGVRRDKPRAVAQILAVSRWLVECGIAVPGRLGIWGGSNGGLVAAAAMVQAPDLYRVVACGAPLLDMVRYERFGMGRAWTDEYGTVDDPGDFECLLSYSPYHNIPRNVALPATLFALFEDDEVVSHVHAMKMLAAMSDGLPPGADASRRPLVLMTPRGGGGHGSRSHERSANLLTFYVNELLGPL